MTKITAKEVVHHARPIARAIGIHGMETSLTSNDVCIDFGEDGLDAVELAADRAAALIIGLIVVGCPAFQTYANKSIVNMHPSLKSGEAGSLSDDPLTMRFQGACEAFAKATGVRP